MKKYIRINQKVYDIVAEQYAKKDFLAKTNMLFYEPWLEMIFSKFDLKIKHTALDLGAGTGQILKILEDNNFDTIGIELSKSMASYIKEISPRSKIIEEDILAVSLNNDSFNLILGMAFIHLFDERDLIIVLNKVKKWMKRDGYFAICTTKHEKTEKGYFIKNEYKDSIIRYRKKWRQDELEKFIINNGFEIIDSFIMSEITTPRVWISYMLKKN